MEYEKSKQTKEQKWASFTKSISRFLKMNESNKNQIDPSQSPKISKTFNFDSTAKKLILYLKFMSGTFEPFIKKNENILKKLVPGPGPNTTEPCSLEFIILKVKQGRFKDKLTEQVATEFWLNFEKAIQEEQAKSTPINDNWHEDNELRLNSDKIPEIPILESAKKKNIKENAYGSCLNLNDQSEVISDSVCIVSPQHKQSRMISMSELKLKTIKLQKSNTFFNKE